MHLVATSPLLTLGLPIAGAACAALAYTALSPTSHFWGPVIPRGDAAKFPDRYALTFDDGPTDDSTARILDSLGEHGAKAAFFVIGVNARRCPEIVRRAFDEGHVVANHSFDHSHFGVMRAGWYWDRQIEQTDALLREIIGVKPLLFRPPMGAKQFHILRAARRHGHAVVTWSRRGRDGVTTTADRIVERLAPATQGGDIVILHDGVEPNQRRDPAGTVAAVGPLIRALRERGLEPMRLDEMIGVRPYS